MIPAGTGAFQPVNTPVDYVFLALPTRAKSTGPDVHLKDLGSVAVHLAVATGG